MNKITAIALREEVEKKQNKERLSEHDETSIKFLKEAINCIPLANEDGADFENTAFIFNPPAGQFIVKAGKGDWDITFLMAATVKPVNVSENLG